MSEKLFFCLGAFQRLETARESAPFSSTSWRESVDEVPFGAQVYDKNTLKHQQYLLSPVPLTRTRGPAITLVNKSLTSSWLSPCQIAEVLQAGSACE